MPLFLERITELRWINTSRELGWRLHSVYSASKACMEAFARVWSIELGHEYGVTVNCVNPGPVETEMW